MTRTFKDLMFYAQFRHICTLHGPVYEVRPMQRKIDLKNVVFSKKYDPDFLCLWFLCFANIIFVYDKRYFLKIYDFWPCILQYLQQLVQTNYVTKANSRLFFQSCLQYVTQIFVQCWLINFISKNIFWPQFYSYFQDAEVQPELNFELP